MDWNNSWMETVVTLNEYESAAMRTINPALNERERLFDAAAGLAEEAGEVLGQIRKHVYQDYPLDRARLTKELGDALWCLTITARTAGISLEEIALANIEKLRRRYPDGFSNDASRNRDTA
jgi:NTP pyrophosphatase (non-canonical NTP hydrolase)